MGLLIFGIFIIVGGGVVIGLIIREPKELMGIGSKIWISLVVLAFMFMGLLMVMHNDIVFNTHIKVYNNGDYTKEILYDAKGNEIDVKYKITGVK